MRRGWILVLAFTLSSITAALSISADDVEAGAAQPERLRLVVFEVAGCTYCSMFKQQIEPIYVESAQAKLAPLQYVDITNGDPKDLLTLEPITIAPTVVLFRGNREVDRIPGYSGPQTFLTLVDTMVASSR